MAACERTPQEALQTTGRVLVAPRAGWLSVAWVYATAALSLLLSSTSRAGSARDICGSYGNPCRESAGKSVETTTINEYQ